MSDTENGEVKRPERKRSLTSITLGWLSEKLRRSEQIKESLKSGSYKVDSEKIAQSILSKS
jgi:anti-sigma28 factor (negative regulator of flagellin synthesis)